MSTPAIIVLVWIAITLLASARLHGQPKTETKWNFWHVLIGHGVCFAVLYWGGFFN